MDQQIFALQEYGGISRLFAELAEEFTSRLSLDVSLEKLDMGTRNHYLLANESLSQALNVRNSRTVHGPLFRYLLSPRRLTSADITHATFYLSRGLKDFPNTPRVVTVHDMIPEIFPESERRLDRITDKREYVQRADHVICVSESTKFDLLRIYGNLQVPITVVPHGVSPFFMPVAGQLDYLPDEYLLHVGKRNGYKDAGTLFRAFARICQDFPSLALVLVGGGGLTRSERVQISRLGIAQRVSQLSISDEDMPAAYSGARAFVLPSRYEGFGLPVLEAMACGTPVILAEASSLPEVAGECALYFRPGDAMGLASAIAEILTFPERGKSLVERGSRRAQEFTWQRTAEATTMVYRQVLGS